MGWVAFLIMSAGGCSTAWNRYDATKFAVWEKLAFVAPDFGAGQRTWL